jgi:hypothetical protein
MPELQIETYQAQFMIMGRKGRYVARTARDHETARREDARFLALGPDRDVVTSS